ncbi:G-protein coupled receptor 161-like isoform X1 [Lineus longissimus]|uniref:G-protein coupled receptor 161-like isoform X1 n=1 Tax=Lineus longissimus TaxID=88925 RepID=UPI002B4F1B3A
MTAANPPIPPTVDPGSNTTAGVLFTTSNLNVSTFEPSVVYFDPAQRGVLCTFMIVIFLASLIGNALVFVVFYRKQSLLTISNRFILNLALTNFLMAVFVMPFCMVSTVTGDWVFGNAWCQIMGLLTTLLCAACILTLLVISLDRYCAIVTPLHYNMRMTTARSNYALAVVWVVSVVFSIPPIFGWNRFAYQHEKLSCTVYWKGSVHKDRAYTIFFTSTCFFIPFVLMIWVYVTIIRAAQVTSARARRNSILPESSEQQPMREPLSGRRNSFPARRGSSISTSRLGLLFQKDEWKAAKTGLIIMTAFTLCWLPYFVIISLESTLDIPSSIPPSIEAAAVWMALAGCAINPFVYFFRNSLIREEIPKVLGRRPSIDTDLPARTRPRRCSDPTVPYSGRRRSSVSTAGTTVTCLSASSLQSEDSFGRTAVTPVNILPDAPNGWAQRGARTHRRSLDSILANRPFNKNGISRQASVLETEVDSSDSVADLPGVPREMG